jgi:hypothetical protein
LRLRIAWYCSPATNFHHPYGMPTTFQEIHLRECSKPRDVNLLMESSISLIPHLKLPYDTKTHFVSSRTHIPIQIPMAEISPIVSPRRQLLQIVHVIQQRYTRFATHPCMPHVQAARAYQPDALSERSDIDSSVNNVGSIERRLPLSWKGAHGTESVIELESVLFSVRLTTLTP